VITLRVLNATPDLERLLLEQPFVSHVSVVGDTVTFQFTDNDVERARLLRLLVERGFSVVEFQGKTENLEDAFMAITEGIMQ
jgi:hypothetical protein